jgi:hypothetical protein
MRRFAFILGMLLTLTAGVWGSALAASAWCMHETSAPSAPDEHDCCRAKLGESNAHHSEAQGTSHDDAVHENSTTEDESHNAHAGMNCDGANASATPEHAPAALVQHGLSCAECCAGGSRQAPATAVFVAPEQNKVKRAAANDSTGAGDLFAHAPIRVSHLAATQHAPPVPPERRHVLISVFLI